jgi:hypothetical protein
MSQEQWRERWRDFPLRLRLGCRAAGVDLPPVYRSVEVKHRDASRDDSQVEKAAADRLAPDSSVLARQAEPAPRHDRNRRARAAHLPPGQN